MNISRLLNKLKQITIHKLIVRIYSILRVIKYRILSNCKSVSGKAIFNSPVLINGLGIVKFEGRVNLGVLQSPYFFNSYIYIEARNPISVISIGDGVWINNNSTIISEGPGITICKNTLIGPNFSVYDTDFHNVNPNDRSTGLPSVGRVWIDENVFIGGNVTILKGVEIGRNSVIANGSVVTKSIPANVVAGGNPCKIIKNLE